MNAIPGIVAGVKRIVMINPALNGKQNAAVLYAAKKCGINEIYTIGGPSAIAAVAYGTRKIKKVDKVVGPGNAYVAQAKREVFGEIGIEASFAGPSEILVVADSMGIFERNHAVIDIPESICPRDIGSSVSASTCLRGFCFMHCHQWFRTLFRFLPYSHNLL